MELFQEKASITNAIEIIMGFPRKKTVLRSIILVIGCWLCLVFLNTGIAQTRVTATVGGSNKTTVPSKNSPNVTPESRSSITVGSSNAAPTPNDSFVSKSLTNGTLSAIDEQIQRQVMELALKIASTGNSWGGSQDNIEFTTNTGQQVKQQAMKQPAPAFDKSEKKIVAQEKRKREVQQQRDEYKRKIRAHFDKFQKDRYQTPHYNGIRSDYSGYNQSFQSIARK